MIPIVTPEEMRAVDAEAPESVEDLIERAGGAIARVALDMLGGAYGRVVTVIAGSGNNGADGRSAAARLQRRGVKVQVVDAAMRPPVLPPSDLVIDAAYGTGFRGDWIAPRIVGRRGGVPLVLAVDIPSGVDAATGRAGDHVLAADRTVTFQALKPGLVFGRGRHLAGDVLVVDIGLDVGRAERFVVTADDVAAWWPRRPADAHKWRGAVRLVAGSDGMSGAARLCASAAARAGAGLVSLSTPGAVSFARGEILQPPIPSVGFAEEVLADLDRFQSLAIGPGLGRAEPTIDGVRRLIGEASVPVVVDGDGIFAAAWSAEGAAELLAPRTLPTVVTPHDGEYALLHGEAPSDDRIAAARTLAAALDCTVLLKGPATVVADPAGPTLVVDHGDERLATAGSGDVLTGIIAALLAADVPAARAGAAAAWVHAEAARRCPPMGLLAGDLVDALPQVLSELVA